MLPFIKGKGNCTGCTACYSVCPVHCIEMEQDEEGFLYPVASDACINCEKCEKVCPIHNRLEGNKGTEQIAYAAVAKDKKIWRRSASGGAFSEICRTWDDGDTVYAGAAFDGLCVHHICVNGFDKIAPLCKSKYVASSLGDTFLILKRHIDNGKRALFCGTPCQVAGIRAYLGKDYENLLLIDLICHGVGSPKVFETCVDMIGKQIGASITGYQFRAKRSAFELVHLQRVNYGNDMCLYLEDDAYMQLFLSQYCLRPSCGENCKYRNEHRQGDLTIADFKGLENVFPDLVGEKRNYSTIVVNTEKGMHLIKNIQKTMNTYKCSLDDVKEYNPLFYKQTWFSNERDTFFIEFIASPKSTIEKWTEPARINKISLKRYLWNSLPVSTRKWVINNIFKEDMGGGGGVMYSSCALTRIIYDKCTLENCESDHRNCIGVNNE